MSIPNEIKIGILGAGGKMGMRIGANLKKLSAMGLHRINAAVDHHRDYLRQPQCRKPHQH